MNGPVLIDVTGKSDIINLNHVRSLHVKRFAKDGKTTLMSLELVYSDSSEDRFMLERGRWSVLEETLLDLMVGF